MSANVQRRRVTLTTPHASKPSPVRSARRSSDDIALRDTTMTSGVQRRSVVLRPSPGHATSSAHAGGPVVRRSVLLPSRLPTQHAASAALKVHRTTLSGTGRSSVVGVDASTSFAGSNSTSSAPAPSQPFPAAVATAAAPTAEGVSAMRSLPRLDSGDLRAIRDRVRGRRASADRPTASIVSVDTAHGVLLPQGRTVGGAVEPPPAGSALMVRAGGGEGVAVDHQPARIGRQAPSHSHIDTPSTMLPNGATLNTADSIGSTASAQSPSGEPRVVSNRKPPPKSFSRLKARQARRAPAHANVASSLQPNPATRRSIGSDSPSDGASCASAAAPPRTPAGVFGRLEARRARQLQSAAVGSAPVSVLASPLDAGSSTHHPCSQAAASVDEADVVSAPPPPPPPPPHPPQHSGAESGPTVQHARSAGDRGHDAQADGLGIAEEPGELNSAQQALLARTLAQLGSAARGDAAPTSDEEYERQLEVRTA